MSSDRLSMTVVTPSYNQGRFIGRTIESVLAQGTPGLEYLIFDARSTDETAEVLARYAGRVRAVIEADKGQADAVNKGLRAATGDVIAWLNSDDVYYPGAFARVLAAFEADPLLDVVYGDADHIDADDRFIEPYPTEPFDYRRLQEVCFFCQPATFFRRRVVARDGELRVDLRYCMDYEYWLRICAARPPLHLPHKLAGSRLYAENKTLGSRAPVHREILGMLAEKFDRPAPRWVYNMAHVVVEEAGHTRETPAKNLAFVRALVAESTSLFKQFGGVPIAERITMAKWLWGARRGAR
jgi:glycosyltransferase involved in cell wall biosynthesis